jgi:hypothetical protein
MELAAIIQRAMQICKSYALLEQQRYGRSWSREEVALSFVGDVGDLVKLVKRKLLAYNMMHHTSNREYS